jgi:hypothetical protein
MRVYRSFFLATAVILFSLGSAALAFWPLTHGLLGVDSGLNISPGYHQAPDTWPSYDPNNVTAGIFDEFCWGHVIPRYWGYWCPRPWYYGFGGKYVDNDPAEHIRVLLNDKLLPAHVVQPKMGEFRRGFAAHNAEDQGGAQGKNTHFDLAPGAESFLTIPYWLKHGPVEEAIESVAYVDICYAGDANLAFIPNDGNAVGLPSSPVDYAAMIDSSVGDTDTDGLLCLAMKVFRKKQQTVDLHAEYLKALTPLSRSAIGSKRIQSLSMSRAKLLGPVTRAKWEEGSETLYGYWRWEGPPGDEDWVWYPPIWPEAPNWRQYYDAARQAASQVQ